uniref:Uncharacterized protein n=1 Tax=Parascaris univalens TaxID=6257 RepID=A0A914ZUS0_PARUN
MLTDYADLNSQRSLVKFVMSLNVTRVMRYFKSTSTMTKVRIVPSTILFISSPDPYTFVRIFHMPKASRFQAYLMLHRS